MCDEVKVINIPFFDGLTVDSILNFAANKPEVMLALPEVERERKKLPRSYISNVTYTILGKLFQNWVDKKVLERNTKVQK